MNKVIGKILLINCIISVSLTVILPTSEPIGYYLYKSYDIIFSIVNFTLSIFLYFFIVRDKTEDVNSNRLKFLLSITFILSLLTNVVFK
ncbi:hypothetical protein AF60_00180 [Streptococcus uberis S6261]|uniref:Membrane protein n=1 Tax=Streptococcus uberis (strain ATCC BAA-854 / 0140J) TaxID=218495 RepID=B9DSS1_STRU0|nr:hypothetical protein AF60_00180 [Streptococcus uberis S6261]CAR40388.1 putative membrane protein [Streptococcus uberis 0140J]